MTTSTPTKDGFTFYAEPSQLTPASDLYAGWGSARAGRPCSALSAAVATSN